MDILANLSLGFGIALSPYTLMLAVIGCFIGTIVGALPGLGPSNGVAIMIPLTFSMGLDDALSGGPLEGAPLQDVVVRLDRVMTYGPASSAQALRIAAASAVRDAISAAGGALMQPVMAVEIVVPDEF